MLDDGVDCVADLIPAEAQVTYLYAPTTGRSLPPAAPRSRESEPSPSIASRWIPRLHFRSARGLAGGDVVG